MGVASFAVPVAVVRRPLAIVGAIPPRSGKLTACYTRPGIIHCAITVTLWITRIGLGESLLILAVVRYNHTHQGSPSRCLFLLREKSNQVAAQWSLRSHCDAPHHDNHLTARREGFMPNPQLHNLQWMGFCCTRTSRVASEMTD